MAGKVPPPTPTPPTAHLQSGSKRGPMLPERRVSQAEGRQLGLHVAASITSTQKNLEAKAGSPGKQGGGRGCAVKVITDTLEDEGLNCFLSYSVHTQHKQKAVFKVWTDSFNII